MPMLAAGTNFGGAECASRGIEFTMLTNAIQVDSVKHACKSFNRGELRSLLVRSGTAPSTILLLYNLCMNCMT